MFRIEDPTAWEFLIRSRMYSIYSLKNIRKEKETAFLCVLRQHQRTSHSVSDYIKRTMCFHMEYGIPETLVFVHLYRMTSHAKVDTYPILKE